MNCMKKIKTEMAGLQHTNSPEHTYMAIVSKSLHITVLVLWTCVTHYMYNFSNCSSVFPGRVLSLITKLLSQVSFLS